MDNTSSANSIYTVEDWVKQVRDFRRPNARFASSRYWFRGQARSTEHWPLRPGVYRDGFLTEEEKQSSQGEDRERLNKERHLLREFRVLSAGLPGGKREGVDLYVLQQHYEMPTRLLDWSMNALAALYFAVETATHPEYKDEIGEVFIMDVLELPGSHGIMDDNNQELKAALLPIVNWQDVDFPEDILPVWPPYFDIRMTLQRSCFTFHVPKKPQLDPLQNGFLRSYRIPCSAKRSIKQELSALGIDAFSLYGDRESLSRSLKAAYRVNEKADNNDASAASGQAE